jgi:hypothetical protein
MPYDGPPCTYILTDIFVIPSRISYDAFEGRLHTFQLVSRPTCSTTDFIASQTTIQFNPVVLQVVGTHDPTIVPTVASNVVERSVVRQIVSRVSRLNRHRPRYRFCLQILRLRLRLKFYFILSGRCSITL